ncbi:signal transduction histidine kinase [Spinactinospora alkalitolerans]|uniref:histidine kinase n=1 Tax=Spinactinospora alkalitolerans TaxID=687207 RepID=A0A852TTU6_9ACTN|nr:histidine kinase [Spinactinospora alkalitolerans]NYE47449.1 signal transduction histidine kinase [Spinactinospora alkalitolerans]
MSTAAAFPLRPVTYLRVVFLLLGSALALSFALLDGTLILIAARHLEDWLTIVIAAVVVAVPPVLVGLVAPARQVEAVAAESLLGVDFPDGVPGPAHRTEQRIRAAVWFVVHVLAGGVVVVDAATLIPLGLALIAAPLNLSAGDPVSSVDWLRATGGWSDAWMPFAGLACLVIAVAIPVGLGALLARAAPALLGPSYAERLQRLEAVTARLTERNRIARELHDSVGHALSLVTLQAVAARKLLTRDPEFADGALETIESTSRSATADLDHMLGLLREGAARKGADRFPAPDLEVLDELVAATRAAGLDVRADVHGNLGGLPTVISREAYRIVQEGLTNALRHAVDASARLQVAKRPGCLAVTLVNPTAAGAPLRPGRGLRGMEERVHALGGSITNVADGGTWSLAVELPLPKDGAA